MNTPGDPLRGLRERKERIDKERQPEPPKGRRPGRVRKTFSLPSEVEEQIEQVLTLVQKQIDPGFSHHALCLAILDQCTRAILAGKFGLEIEQTETRTTEFSVKT
ncbi:MAG TPA: hypothetical protein VMW58_04600 [Anaerolineae bacterium]|nr:hypothetical protein [Anaerolineae bacterium]